jgi:hypothetical protein
MMVGDPMTNGRHRETVRARCSPFRPVLAAALVIAGACTPGQAAGVYFPSVTMSEEPTALLDATLHREGRCLVLSAGGETMLALWFSKFAPIEVEGRIAITSDGRTPLVVEGVPARFGGGGGYRDAEHRDFVEQLVGPIPEDCVRPSYWLVADL